MLSSCSTTQSDSTFKLQVERLKTENARLKKELVDIEDERLINVNFYSTFKIYFTEGKYY